MCLIRKSRQSRGPLKWLEEEEDLLWELKHPNWNVISSLQTCRSRLLFCPSFRHAQSIGTAFFFESLKRFVSGRLGSSLFCRPSLNPLSHTNQGYSSVCDPSVHHWDRPGTSATPFGPSSGHSRLKGGTWCWVPWTRLRPTRSPSPKCHSEKSLCGGGAPFTLWTCSLGVCCCS